MELRVHGEHHAAFQRDHTRRPCGEPARVQFLDVVSVHPNPIVLPSCCWAVIGLCYPDSSAVVATQRGAVCSLADHPAKYHWWGGALCSSAERIFSSVRHDLRAADVDRRRGREERFSMSGGLNTAADQRRLRPLLGKKLKSSARG